MFGILKMSFFFRLKAFYLWLHTECWKRTDSTKMCISYMADYRDFFCFVVVIATVAIFFIIHLRANKVKKKTPARYMIEMLHFTSILHQICCCRCFCWCCYQVAATAFAKRVCHFSHTIQIAVGFFVYPAYTL